MFKKIFNLFKTKIAKIFTVGCLLFVSSFALTSCDVAKPQDTKAALEYRITPSTEGTLLEYKFTIQNDTVLNIKQAEVKFNLFKDGVHVFTTDYYHSETNINHNNLGYFKETIIIPDIEFDEVDINKWAPVFDSFWNSYYIWLITLISIVVVAVIILNVLIYVNDLDIEDVFTSWYIYPPLVLILITLASIIPVAGIGWIPLCLAAASEAVFAGLAATSCGIAELID